MKQPTPADDWPVSWKEAYEYDLIEVFGQRQRDPGYAYAYDNRVRHALELIERVAGAGARILDVAGAQGNFSLLLAERGYSVVWNDLRSELEGYVRLKHERGDLSYLPGEIFEVSPPDRHVDVVLASEIIEHVAHPDRLLRRLAALVKPGGHIVLTTPNGRYLRNPLPRFSDFTQPEVFEGSQFKPNADGHIFLLHPDEIEPLARQARLAVLDLTLFTNVVTAGCLGTAPLTRRLPPRWIEAGEAASRGAPRFLRERMTVHMACLMQRLNEPV
jgi:2-polyprenyl-6-hydroxyphenyl methylase/3-demethylubiquinone-9 3-methyltransferase